MIRRVVSLSMLVATLVGLYLVVLSGSFGRLSSNADAEAGGDVDAPAAVAPGAGGGDATGRDDGAVGIDAVTLAATRGVDVDLDRFDRLAPGSEPADAALPDAADDLLTNSDLETDADADGLADCWTRDADATDADFERLERPDMATTIEAAVMGTAGDGSVRIHTAQRRACAPEVRAGDELALTSTVRATAPVRPVLFRLDADGRWSYWTVGPYLSIDGRWHTERWSLPPVPSDTRRISVGFELLDVGRMEVDHASLVIDRAERISVDPQRFDGADTVVSITFDDGRASQIRALPVLEAHDVAATFFVNSGRLGSDGYLRVDQLRELAAAGHEIGGHTVDHARLVALAPDEQRRQICNDRAVLVGLGFDAQALAYPLSSRDLSAVDGAQDCGYGAARLAGGLDPAGLPAQPLDQVRPYQVPALASVTETTTVADLRAAVLAAEASGGWINLVFHDLCDGCNTYAMSVEDFDAFVGWVADRSARGTVVMPFSAVMGREPGPAIAGPGATRTVDAEAALVNPDFSTSDLRDPAVPLCWDAGWSAGLDATVSVVDEPAPADRFVRLRIDGTVAEGASARIESARDQGECAPSAGADIEPVVSLRHRGSGDAVVEVFVRDPSGAWRFHSRSEPLGDRPDWHRQVWVAEPLPSDAAAISVRVALRTPGQVDIDDVDVGLALRPGRTAAG